MNPNANVIHIPCAECGQSFAPSITKTSICVTCLTKKNNITQGIPKSLMLPWCKYCRRFFGSNWTLCARESKELLSICLKKINGLKKLRLIDAQFIWTEEHARRTKLKLIVEKDINSEIALQQTFEVEFYEVYTQCDDCKKDFTPHTWKANVQVRQKVKNKKTFLYLEQLMLKARIHRKAIKISSVKNGMDFFFKSKSHALKMMEFLKANVPHKTKESKQLVSHDTKSNSYNYKYTFYIEMPKICKNDLIIIPKRLTKEYGGVNNLGVCFKISNKIHLFDPMSMKKYAMNSDQYFNFEHEIEIIPFKENQTQFYVTDIYQEKSQTFNLNTTLAHIDIRFAHVEVNRMSDHSSVIGTTHIGHILKHGDCAKGYDIKSLNRLEEECNLSNQKSLPDVILIQKFYPEKRKKRRIWKLKRMQIEDEEEEKNIKMREQEKQIVEEKNEMDDFIDEIEQDKFMRSKMMLYRDEDGIKQGTNDVEEDEEVVKLGELMKNLEIKETKKEQDFDAFVNELEQVSFKKK